MSAFGKRDVALATGTLAAVALAGCGGGDFTSKANDICKTYNAKLRAIRRPATAAEVPGYLNVATPVLVEGAAKLKALKPPASKQAAYQQYLSILDQEVAVTQQANAAAQKGAVNKAVSLIQRAAPLRTQDRVNAKALGLNDCAK